MRKFKIIGKTTGAIFDLNNKEYLLYAPKNLGLKFKNSFVKIFNSRFKTESEYEFQDINSVLMMSGYARYETFRNFIAKNAKDGFLFFYSPYTDIERFIECEINELRKEELNFDGTLRCNFIITPKSYWKKDQVSYTEFTESLNVGKFYAIDGEESGDFQYNYGYREDESELVDLFSYNYVYANVGLNESLLINNGDYETSVKITLSGPFINPYLQLVDVNGNTVQDAKFVIAVDSDEKFVINSSPSMLRVSLINNLGEEIDKTGTQDFERTTYLTLPVGEYTLKISEDNEQSVTGTIEYELNYIGA